MILGWKWCLSHSEGPQTQCFHGTFASLMVSLIHQFLLKFDIFFQTADRERACLCHMAQLPFTAEPEKQTSTKTNKQPWHHTFWYNKFRPTKANTLGFMAYPRSTWSSTQSLCLIIISTLKAHYIAHISPICTEDFPCQKQQVFTDMMSTAHLESNLSFDVSFLFASVL